MKPLEELSDKIISVHGKVALGIPSQEWKHAESAHFVYHFGREHIARPVASEAEYYFRFVHAELGRTPASAGPKFHVYVFDHPLAWRQFQVRGGLDPYTGGIQTGNNLFLFRDGDAKFKGATLGHEVAHLVAYRHFGENIPRWINEGYAEFVASRGYAAYHRARGYSAKPVASSVPPDAFIPVKDLTSMMGYPAQIGVRVAFYIESQKLVRFLSAADKAAFVRLFEAVSRGTPFARALEQNFGSKYFDVAALEKEFKIYASKDYDSTP